MAIAADRAPLVAEPRDFWRGWRAWWRRVTSRARARAERPPERRQSYRYECDLSVFCQGVHQDGPSAGTFPCHDLSLGGLALCTPKPFEPGTLLAVRLPGRGRRPGPTRLWLVRHAEPRGAGDWRVGGTFYTELSDDDLDLLRGPPPSIG